MATNDYLIDDQTGADFLVDLNVVLSAIVSNNSNATEPATTFAYMWWADTTAALLKLRNSSNTAWIDILDLTTGASVAFPTLSVNDLTDAVLDGLDNLGLGLDALGNTTTSSNTTAVGVSAGHNITTGDDNTLMGKNAGHNLTTENKNTIVGNNACVTFTGDNNTVVGRNALMKGIGFEITVVGRNALMNNISGIRNIGIGNNVGLNVTTQDDTITIGNDLDTIGSTYFTFGSGSGSNRVYNQFTTNATWNRASDKRIKKDIETNEDCGLGFIKDLRTVTYKFKAPSELSPEMSEYDKNNDKPSHDKPMYGFIAQEVKEALEKHNIKNFAGHHQIDDGKDNMQGISYEMFVVPLVKSVQELVIENQGLSDKIDEQNAAIDAMASRLTALETLETGVKVNTDFDADNIDTGV